MKSEVLTAIVFTSTSLVAVAATAEPTGFPYLVPDKKPDRLLSAAMERLYSDYLAPTPEANELYSTFKFTPLEGLDYHNGDGTISRRDPSKVIRVNGRYYVWYTHRQTPTPPRGAALGTDTIRSTDWDLSEIWYATSGDGFTWKEQGAAIVRPPKPQPGWRSVSTADILVWNRKYYLYYQGFLEMSGKRGDDCPVAVSEADAPDGPWRPANKIVIPTGARGEWDQFSSHTLARVKVTLPQGATECVNWMWEIQDKPFDGDVPNSYNDGGNQRGSRDGSRGVFPTTRPRLWRTNG